MSKKLERLNFIVSLIDKTAGPANKIMRSIDKISNKATNAFRNMTFGAAALVGVGAMMTSTLAPAIEMDRALGEVRSLDVRADAMQALQSQALKFSIGYGESAADFVKSSYDIQSAIDGLAGQDLAKFTNASAVLAKGTKSDVGTITGYMGTMYGIFKQQANQMGKAQWVETLAGQSATAVQMFKTTGSEMSAAFTGLGADATAAGIPMANQMAILGKLQSTMSGSQAGTKYRAFLGGVGKAGKALGLEFTDAQGNMLPMLNILDKIRGKFGDTFDVAESDALAKAFGTKEASGLIKLLMADTAGLQSNIEALAKVQGMDKAAQMANAIADPWEKANSGLTALRISVGNAMLPAIVPLVDKFTAGTQQIMAWSEQFPNLTRMIGYATLGVLAITAAVAVLTIGLGIFKAVSLAISIIWSPITLILLAVVGVLALLIYYWDEWTGFVKNTVAFEIFTVWLNHFWKSLQTVGKAIGWIIEKAAKFFGLEFDTAASASFDAATTQKTITVAENELGGLSGLKKSNIAPGGLLQEISNSNNSRSVGNITINTEQPVAPNSLEQFMAMAAP